MQSEHIRKLRAWPILDLQLVAQPRFLYESFNDDKHKFLHIT